ncbi:MAG: N-acetylmuramoyl-L-alanine amidase [Pseudotabrizicola sp.]|uniref:N-acetylmuramoyl-L-alanine amidase n=1 Tax=Pseudotabrizicola sp. TaxID=2939647 RepID=UPI0027281906|nr:N-acetylmuramoyl-L-alanine amidase [Pseudotabrizicola sp.]MDO8882931.1 N-acetylmuramoyl-L-alanine amidase [Pseudotabrizicola sp.]MDP2082752.1 N-acetylmuramoyl-L-alanine amidase [Pseudotabrizicola sp.]MDZ7576275.1 N-acetylmuramoyl-L-alanine amidase [Pseudotabrizicola sp.]
MRLFVLVLFLLLGPLGAWAQDLSALARLVPERSFVHDQRGGVAVEFALSQPVPWRVRVLDEPPRLVLDMREVDWTGLAAVDQASDAIVGIRAGVVRQGWSRLVMELSGPYLVSRADMVTVDSGAKVRLRLAPAAGPEFAALAALPEPADWALPAVADLPKPVPRGAGPLVVVLDPGHGGLDPGAERDGYTEAGLMLTFARELKDLLLRDGDFLVILTREEDDFVPLEARISIARAAGAHVFLSLHADAIAEGEAVGATIYSLAEEASDAASQALAERHDRADLLSGVDLTAQDDLVATVLMDMARTETGPRIERLALALEGAIKGAGLRMHRHPRQTAGFSVLKSPDIPSVLIELGFMSSARDLARLIDPEWRTKMAVALRDGLKLWAGEDAALQALKR